MGGSRHGLIGRHTATPSQRSGTCAQRPVSRARLISSASYCLSCTGATCHKRAQRASAECCSQSISYRATVMHEECRRRSVPVIDSRRCSSGHAPTWNLAGDRTCRVQSLAGMQCSVTACVSSAVAGKRVTIVGFGPLGGSWATTDHGSRFSRRMLRAELACVGWITYIRMLSLSFSLL